jgi:phage repressor protein C with HTH and peptisase S24 domain
MSFSKLNDNKITIKAGLANGIIGKARKRGSLSQDNISKILQSCNNLNANWLFTGDGEMLLSEKEVVNELSTNENNGIVIPLYNAEASAGIGQLQLCNEYIIDKLKVPFARNEDIALTIVGDSMTPAMQSGDIAVVRNMPNWKEYLDYGNIFIVVTENEVYCKIVQKNTEKDIFTLKSYNTNYSEFEIPKKFISQIYKVIGIISQRSY